jgi:hypothetical protein
LSDPTSGNVEARPTENHSAPSWEASPNELIPRCTGMSRFQSTQRALHGPRSRRLMRSYYIYRFKPVQEQTRLDNAKFWSSKVTW